MKNHIVLFFLFWIISINYIYSQNNNSPIIGYDRMAWGTSINEFQRLYPTAREINTNEADIGIREFKQTNVGGDINSRNFWFFQNRLYMVMVNYGNQDDSFYFALLDKLISIYGLFDDKNEETSSVENGYVKKITLYRYYRNDLYIWVTEFQWYNSRYYKTSTDFVCYYRNPVTYREIYNEKSRRESEKLQL